jgi:hypothetical protein
MIGDLLEYRGLQEEYVCAAAHWQSSNANVRIDRENIVQNEYGTRRKDEKEIY